MIEILTDDHYDKIMDVFESTKKRIKIASPFLSINMAKKLCDIVNNHNIVCTFITRLYLEDMYAKANSIDAIEMMMNAGIKVYALKGLHTKLYLFDDNVGIVGSANFTSGGFISNFELSLMAVDEMALLSNLHDYYDNMVSKISNSDEGLITTEILGVAREKYKSLLDSKKSGNSTTSIFMCGAELDKKKYDSVEWKISEIKSCVDEKDIMQEVFRENIEEVKYNYTIWLKFAGEGSDRLNPYEKFPMIKVLLDGKKVYVENYPYKVGAIKEGDAVYLAAITTDTKGKNQPVIVGSGIMCGFTENNRVQPMWIQEYDWMERYPYYCVLQEAKILNTGVTNGIPLSIVWDELGSNTYVASFGRNETLVEVARKHYQKAHMRLSGNAKNFIDMKLKELGKKYGFIEYISE
ncbi:MAG: NgoFVII family restriction endonuclease [Lachnospiraceae bacterium]|nr:NgoFVII family restriction endonuclease [Lachnospiraceae bacterium]